MLAHRSPLREQYVARFCVARKCGSGGTRVAKSVARRLAPRRSPPFVQLALLARITWCTPGMLVRRHGDHPAGTGRSWAVPAGPFSLIVISPLVPIGAPARDCSLGSVRVSPRSGTLWK